MGDFFNSFSWIEIFKATMVLFAVVDIVGSIPIIIKLKEQSGEEIGALRASAVSLGIMIGFLILGESILNLFGVDVKSFAVAGSLILFAMALEMILGVRLFQGRRIEIGGVHRRCNSVELVVPVFRQLRCCKVLRLRTRRNGDR